MNIAQTDIRHRKARFQADRHYRRAEVETILASFLLHPAPSRIVTTTSRCAAAWDKKRLRPDADVVVDRFYVTDFESRPKVITTTPWTPRRRKRPARCCSHVSVPSPSPGCA
jgi:hypothetical protein